MRIQTIHFSFKLIKHTTLLLAVMICQAFAGFTICIAESGHFEIEYADAACCKPNMPAGDQPIELAEAESPDRGACLDREIADHSLINRAGHSNSIRPAQQSTYSDTVLLSDIAPDTLIVIITAKIPDHPHRIKSILEKTSSPLRC